MTRQTFLKIVNTQKKWLEKFLFADVLFLQVLFVPFLALLHPLIIFFFVLVLIWDDSEVLEVHVMLHLRNLGRAWVSPEYTRNWKQRIFIHIFIYLCIILHSNGSTCMLRHHVVDRLSWLVKVVINAVSRSKIGITAVQCGSSSRAIKICVMEHAIGYIPLNQSYLFISNWSHGSGNYSQLAWYSVVR